MLLLLVVKMLLCACPTTAHAEMTATECRANSQAGAVAEYIVAGKELLGAQIPAVHYVGRFGEASDPCIPSSEIDP